MTAVIIVSIVFASIVLVIAIISTTILTAIRLRRGGLSDKEKKEQNEEARMIQEMHNAMTTMEDRIETLEAILMDHSKPYEDKK
jgi:sensor histidine kinase YesM